MSFAEDCRDGVGWARARDLPWRLRKAAAALELGLGLQRTVGDGRSTAGAAATPGLRSEDADAGKEQRTMKGTERTGAAAMRIGMGRADSDGASGCLLPSSAPQDRDLRREAEHGVGRDDRRRRCGVGMGRADPRSRNACCRCPHLRSMICGERWSRDGRGVRPPGKFEVDRDRGRGLTTAMGMTTSPRRR